MASRSYTVVDFQLTTDTTVQAPPVQVSCRHLLVNAMPAALLGLALLSIDGGPKIQIATGQRFSAAEGQAPFQTVQLYAPAVGGVLELFAANDDTVPFPGSGTSAPAPYFDALWLPGNAAAEGGVLDTSWLGPNGTYSTAPAFWSVSTFGTAGLNPVLTNAGDRAAYHRSNAGQVAVRLGLFDYPWRRLRADVRTVTARPAPAMVRVSVRLGKLAAGGVKGIGSGVWFAPADNTFPGTPTGNNPFVGISQDGAGNYRWRSRHLGGPGLNVDQALVWPAPQTQLVKVTLELWDADPVLGTDGRARLYLNDALAGEITDPAALPTLNGVSQTGYAYLIQDEGANANCQFFNRCRAQIGPLGMSA